MADPDRSSRARRRVIVAGHRGDATTARDELTATDPAVRAAAIGALARIGTLSSDELATALDDADVRVRRRAAELAAGRPGDAPPAIAALLDDREASVVEAAAWASGEREPAEPGVVDRLVGVARDHEDPLCREAAVAALGAIGDPAGLDAVLDATSDKPAIRRRAVLALAAFEDPRVDAAIERALADRDWQTRQAAEDLRRT